MVRKVAGAVDRGVVLGHLRRPSRHAMARPAETLVHLQVVAARIWKVRVASVAAAVLRSLADPTIIQRVKWDVLLVRAMSRGKNKVLIQYSYSQVQSV